MTSIWRMPTGSIALPNHRDDTIQHIYHILRAKLEFFDDHSIAFWAQHQRS